MYLELGVEEVSRKREDVGGWSVLGKRGFWMSCWGIWVFFVDIGKLLKYFMKGGGRIGLEF